MSEISRKRNQYTLVNYDIIFEHLKQNYYTWAVRKMNLIFVSVILNICLRIQSR